MLDAPSALSRHRLPLPYRRLLPLCALCLPALLLLTLLVGVGLSEALFSPRLWLPLLALCLPAAYWWQEGIDVCPTGLRRRIHGRRFLPYSAISAWVFDARPNARVLRVFNETRQIVIECRAAHLSDFQTLIEALEQYAPGGTVLTAPPERAAQDPT
jgi:hypothetical protein